MKRLTDMFIFKYVREFAPQIAACYKEQGIVEAVKRMRAMFNEEGEKATPGWTNQFTGQCEIPSNEERVPNVGLGVAKMLVEWAVYMNINAALKKEADEARAAAEDADDRADKFESDLHKLRVSMLRIAESINHPFVFNGEESGRVCTRDLTEKERACMLCSERGWNNLAAQIVTWLQEPRNG